MVSISILSKFIMLSPKVLFETLCCFQVISMISTMQFNIPQFIILQINGQIIQDFKSLTNFVKANKIFLIINKTDIVLFKSTRNETDVPLETIPYNLSDIFWYDGW